MMTACYCTLLNGVFAVFNVFLEFTKCHTWAGTSPPPMPTLPYQRKSRQGLRDSLPSSKHSTVSRNFLTAWSNSCCYCAPQSFILPSTWYFHTSLPPTSRLKKRDERWRRQFPLVLFSRCCYTQYHKVGSLTQHRCIILQLWSHSLKSVSLG